MAAPGLKFLARRLCGKPIGKKRILAVVSIAMMIFVTRWISGASDTNDPHMFVDRPRWFEGERGRGSADGLHSLRYRIREEAPNESRRRSGRDHNDGIPLERYVEHAHERFFDPTEREKDVDRSDTINGHKSLAVGGLFRATAKAFGLDNEPNEFGSDFSDFKEEEDNAVLSGPGSQFESFGGALRRKEHEMHVGRNGIPMLGQEESWW